MKDNAVSEGYFSDYGGKTLSLGDKNVLWIQYYSQNTNVRVFRWYMYTTNIKSKSNEVRKSIYAQSKFINPQCVILFYFIIKCKLQPRLGF